MLHDEERVPTLFIFAFKVLKRQHLLVVYLQISSLQILYTEINHIEAKALERPNSL